MSSDLFRSAIINNVSLFMPIMFIIMFCLSIIIVLHTSKLVKNSDLPIIPVIPIKNTDYVDVTLVLNDAIGTTKSGTFTQPENTRITEIRSIPLAAVSATANSGTVNARVGTSSLGSDLVTIAASIAAAGAAAVTNSSTALSLVAAGPFYSSTVRQVYITVSNLLGPVSAGGVVRFEVTFERY